ncbi:MAG TPA: hypothetical protein VEF06_02385, partial [Bryobacteraceae bacterium]|nr:hypothetical protein [Bryobacteraceae bacterium]
MHLSRSERGGILTGFLIAAAVLACVALVAGITITRDLRVDSVRTADGEHVSINTPEGNLTIRSHKHAGLDSVDIPRYPGAREFKPGGAAEFEWTSDDGRDDKDFAVAGGELITTDSAAKVLDYYHDRFPAWIVTHAGNGQISLKEPEQDGQPHRFIVIREKLDGTH